MSKKRAKALFELVHTNFCGPKVFTYHLKKKGQIEETFKIFKAFVKPEENG